MSTTADKLRAQFPDLDFFPLPLPQDHPYFHANGFESVSYLLDKGHRKSEGRRPFPSDVIFDRDVEIRMRDNVPIYADIFRPPNSDKKMVPAIIPWSPYGKTGTGASQYEAFMVPFRAGIRSDTTSGYEKFEGPDPAEWCGRDYAIINVDARGAGASHGNISFWGGQEAEDIYDTVDWLSKQPWCNGSVAMMGNSWLAISQINFVSRLHHPALKAIAPMEALVDPYRDLIARGGMPYNPAFHQLILSGFAGPESAENMPAMIEKRPLYDDYWDSKVIKTENIEDIPMYLTASYSSMLHSRGSFHTFRTAKTARKWLRVHASQEWHDLYRPEVNNELHRYFDRYCKGILNGWESETPPVRLSLLGFEGSPASTVVERPEKEYPLARQQLQRYYLDASVMKLVTSPPSFQHSSAHEGHDLSSSAVKQIRD